MKKTLKLVGIFIAVLLVGVVGGLSGYFLIQKNKTYYIYDLRIVEPAEGANTYIYMNSERQYNSIKNKKVYMTADKDNMFEIAVYSITSNKTRNIKITSSNKDVAEIVYIDGKCYVEYKKAGEATITASIDKVVDSFDLYVYNQSAEDFYVYDKTYYGSFAQDERFLNNIVAYADDIEYQYDFITNSIFDDSDDAEVNGDLLRVDSYDEDVFSKVEIDASNRKLIVKCKSTYSEELIENQELKKNKSIIVQSYAYSKEGELKPSKKYPVDVRVIADTPEFLQMVVSSTPDFDDSYIFMDTLDFNYATDEYIDANIEEFLSYQKAEQYLSLNGENSTYTAFFTDKVSEIYIKFRKVYTNGDIVYLNPMSKANGNPYTIECENGYLELSQNKEYYTLNLNRDYFETASSNVFNLTLKLDDFIDFSSAFVFEFKELSADNIEDFYGYNGNTKTFEYIYWDRRTEYSNEICDANGNIVNFGGIDIDFDSLTSIVPIIPDEPVDTDEENNTETQSGEA